MSREVRELALKIKELDPKDPYRVEASARLMEKLYSMGLIPTKWNLKLCSNVTASSFCRRRLPCLMVRSKMAPDLRTAVTFIEQGHVRVGPEVVKDPAFLVTSLPTNLPPSKPNADNLNGHSLIFWIAISRLFWLPPKIPDSPQSPKLVGGEEGGGERHFRAPKIA
ncbi:U3 small nucleolar ribonucleoprotein IMP3 [Portunus trituberculatus]|uniref:U3 small nucleolar ribonucleoprotein IMP3 n=1 Tax=Portunus trituberculatus TaxID=210409 RepID=A0A5B7F6J5_PORTR|nr:U3 small nucleolar ribonucleoprotein IMP3 [Portunus trituberculatus]